MYKTMRCALVALACLAAGLSGIAQSATDGAVGGTVKDKTGAVVAGAQVIVTNNGTNASQTATSDADGFFRAIHLQPGGYTVTVQAPGFQTYKANVVTVEVGQLTNVDAILPIGNSTTTVEVTSEAAAINTTSPEFSNVIDQVVLTNLPVNNYRWSSYAQLTPGVVADSNGFGLLSFRGQSTLQNNITIDGADDNQAFFAEERGRTRAGYSTAQSAVQEFQVNTSNYTVEYGRAVGGVVNSITRSGTNQFHGDFYFRDRDAGWGTKNPFTTITRQDATGAFVSTVFKPKDWRKQFGGGVGGPIFKDKVFFFLAIDKFKRNFPGTGVATSPATFFATPDAALPTGKVCGATTAAGQPANPAQPSTIDAAACTLATNLSTTYAVGATNYTSGLAGLNSMLGAVPRTGDQNIFFPKVDWQINDKNHASFEANRLTWASPAGIQTQATNIYAVRSFGDDFVKVMFGIAKLDTTVTTHLVNEVRYQYGRDFEFQFAQQPATPYEQQYLLKGAGAGYVNPFGLPPAGFITNGFNFGTQTFLQRSKYPDERRYQIADTANYNAGKHSFKFGVDYLHTYDLSSNLRTQFGSYSYTNVQTYLTDLYRSQSAATAKNAKNFSSYQQAFGPLSFEFTTLDYGFFAQDEWKILPRLSLTLGARYDYQQMPTPFASVANPRISQTQSFPSDKNNIAPRVGFSYDVFGSGKTAFRGGFGMFYGRTINSTIYSALTSTGNTALSADGITPVSQLTFSYNSSSGPNFPQVLPNLGTALATAAPAAVFFNPKFQSPYAYQFDLSVQQDMGWRTTLAIDYLGAMGRELANFVDTNLPPPTGTITYTVVDKSGVGPLANGSTYTAPFYAKQGTTATCLSQRPNCAYGAMTAITSNANSNYHALAAQLKHQATRNLTFQANYTWSHALDFGVNNSTFTDTNDQVDPLRLRADYGNSNQNVPNRVVVFAVYTTPEYFKGGVLKYLFNSYGISPSFSGQSGLPYSAATSGTPQGGSGQPSGAFTSIGVQSPIGGGVNGSNGAFRIEGLRNKFQFKRDLVTDLRVSKQFRFGEATNLELLIESFNLANHQNVTSVNTTGYFVAASGAAGGTGNTITFNTNSSSNAPVFGTPTNANSNLQYSPRQIQVGAKLHF